MVAATPYLQDFYDYLTFQKSYSGHTISAYARDLDQFFAYQAEVFGVDSPEATKTDYVRSWVVKLVEDQVKPASVNRKLSTLKSFFKYMRMMEHMDENPASSVRNLKIPGKVPSYVRKSESDRMLDEVLGADDFSILETTVVSLLYHTGIRRSELIDLQVSNVDLRAGQMKVLGKGKKERIVPLGAEVVEILEEYMDYRRAINTENNHVFVRGNGKQLYPKWVYNCVKKMLTLYSNSDKKSPHVLRHSFATHLLQNGAEIAAIKELLGHASLASTQIYAQSDIAHLKKIHKLHPKS